MEVYIPYIIGSSVSAFIGRVAYSYYYTDEDDGKNVDDIKSNDENRVKSGDSINYNLVDERLNERVVDSNKNKRRLGTTTKDKVDSLYKIIYDELGHDMPINNTKKVRSKWLRLINDYETRGHDEFIYQISKKKRKYP
jgi:hypothetical protein|tara:strand:- start:1372 stop:1785 length:414 start_codon:yes stop_codon:yes gene_type:complete